MKNRLRINWAPRDPQLRKFGWIAFAGFPVIGGFVFLIGSRPDVIGIWVVFGSLTLACGLFARFSPKRLKPIYLLVMSLAAMIGQIFVLIFLPIARFVGLAGSVDSNRKADPETEGEWWFRIGPAIQSAVVEWSDPGNFDGKAENIPDDERPEE